MSATLFSFPINKKSNMVMYYIPNFGDWRNSIKGSFPRSSFHTSSGSSTFVFPTLILLFSLLKKLCYTRWPRQETVPLQPHLCCCVCNLFAQSLMQRPTWLVVTKVGHLTYFPGLMERALKPVMCQVYDFFFSIVTIFF